MNRLKTQISLGLVLSAATALLHCSSSSPTNTTSSTATTSTSNHSTSSSSSGATMFGADAGDQCELSGTVPLGGSCKTADDCCVVASPAGSTGSTVCAKGKCAGTAGSTCSGASDCSTNVCTGGVCGYAGNHGPCVSEDDCGEGAQLECVGGVCLTPDEVGADGGGGGGDGGGGSDDGGSSSDDSGGVSDASTAG